MTKQTDSPDRAEAGAAHRRAWDTIPWLVNGSASDAQRRAVEAHLHDCGDCREEL
jgi:anti-sigma factor RsiW